MKSKSTLWCISNQSQSCMHAYVYGFEDLSERNIFLMFLKMDDFWGVCGWTFSQIEKKWDLTFFCFQSDNAPTLPKVRILIKFYLISSIKLFILLPKLNDELLNRYTQNSFKYCHLIYGPHISCSSVKIIQKAERKKNQRAMIIHLIIFKSSGCLVENILSCNVFHRTREYANEVWLNKHLHKQINNN